ncbi:MAG: hypothetical protein RLZZ401_1669 [Pseudomonadota bacterium]|jgi:predicted nucleic acid-binding protein
MVLVYVDTSAWIAQQLRELKTEAVQAWVEAHGMAGLASAEWVKTEYACALSIKRRRGDIDDALLARAHRAFDTICMAGPAWLPVEKQDFAQAARLCTEPATRMRAGDALHLAVALRCQCDGFLSLDAVLNDNAQRHGLRTIPL